MNDFNSQRTKPWDFYTSINPSSSESVPDKEVTWRNFGTSNAISFGFVATAILISMFLIMAIFEHLLRPRSSLISTRDGEAGSLEAGTLRARTHLLQKLGSNPPTAGSSYASDFSVDAGATVPYFHRPTCTSCMSERRDMLAIPWS